MNTTKMIYEGQVEVALKINGHIHKLQAHNSGTDYLKYVFAKCLVTPEDITMQDAPGYLAIYKNSTSSTEEAALTIRDVLLSGRQLTDLVTTSVYSVYTAATFTGYISYDDLNETVDPTTTDTFTIYLLTKDTKVNNQEIRYRLAAFAVSPELLSYISPGVTATVTWTLKLLNKSEES